LIITYGSLIVSVSFAKPGTIEYYPDTLNLPAEVYRFAAEAYQAEIDHIAYPELVDMSTYYNKMAGSYWCANDTAKAIAAEQKAIETFRSSKKISAANFSVFESQLQQYRNKQIPKD
jgi:hypothetical protein